MPTPADPDDPFDVDDERERVATPRDYFLAAACREAEYDDDLRRATAEHLLWLAAFDRWEAMTAMEREREIRDAIGRV